MRRLPARRRLWAAWLLLAAAAAPAQAAEVSVEIEGVDGKLADNVRNFLSIAAEHEDPWTPARIRRLHRRARGEIRQALQPFGYYQPGVDAELTGEDQNWTARYIIDPGQRTRITSLELTVDGPGKDMPALEQALADSKLREGGPLDHSEYKRTKAALSQAAYAAGYLDASYAASSIRVHPEQASAEVRLALRTGERYYFGPVSIEQSILNPDFAARYVPFERGTPFDAERLIDLQLALSDSDYFNRVEVTAEREQVLQAPDAEPAPQVPVTVTAEPRKPRRYTVSAGYGTDTGPRVGLGAEFRRLNRRGHQFRTDLRVSAIERTLAARYDIPIDNVLRDRLSFRGSVASEEIGDARTDQYRLATSREDGWALGRRRFYLNLERENFDFGGPSRTSTLLFPGANFSAQRADDSLRPRLGASISLDVHGGSDAIVSSTSFLQATVTGNVVLPAGDKGRLLARTELGATETDDFGALPPSQRFFAGGDRSVRGYGYQEIGPENADGDVIGGQYKAVASLEAEYLFYGNFGAAVFFDAGDAAMSTGLDVKRGVGVGFRWRSPIGTLRVDFAHPLDDPDNDFRLHFSLGPDL